MQAAAEVASLQECAARTDRELVAVRRELAQARIENENAIAATDARLGEAQRGHSALVMALAAVAAALLGGASADADSCRKVCAALQLLPPANSAAVSA